MAPNYPGCQPENPPGRYCGPRKMSFLSRPRRLLRRLRSPWMIANRLQAPDAKNQLYCRGRWCQGCDGYSHRQPGVAALGSIAC
jgi:hypothetical protein